MRVKCQDCDYIANSERDYDWHDRCCDHPFRSDDMEQCHVTRIIPTGRDGMYRATCSICGRFTTPHLRADAQAIADRHAQQQGFE